MIYTQESLIIDIAYCLCYNVIMIKNQQINIINKRSSDLSAKTSMLENFSLGFEYNKTLQEVKREVRMRTLKVAKAS